MSNIRKKKERLPDFTGKLVSVGLVDGEARSVDCPHWEIQGNKLFLVGTVPRGGSPKDWCIGIKSAIAWDQVTDYLAFDSAAQYRERLAVYHGKKHKA
jgi:hypothetical protein